MAWADLAGLKADKGIDPSDTRDDAVLIVHLDAAKAFVERVRPEFDYPGDGLSGLPPVPADLVLGTYRLAARWFARRRSPDALIVGGETGSSRVPSFDTDIDRLLGIGRFRKAYFA
jgi:hypothetical protein